MENGILPHKQSLKKLKMEDKKNHIITEWQIIKERGKRAYVISQLKRDALLGLMLSTAMHFQLGMSISEYFTIEFVARAVIYVSIYSIGSMFFSLTKWKILKKKYKAVRREGSK